MVEKRMESGAARERGGEWQLFGEMEPSAARL